MAQNGLNSESNLLNVGLSDVNWKPASERSIGATAFVETVNLFNDNPRSLVTDMIGTNPLAHQSVTQSVESMGVVRNSAGATQANAQVAQGAQVNLSAHIANTKEQIKDAQADMRGKLDEAFDNSAGADGSMRDEFGNGYTRGQAHGSFGGSEKGLSDGAEFGAAIASAAMPGMAGKATRAADVLSEMRSAMGGGQAKLPVKLQNRLSEEMAKIHYHDPNTSDAMKGRIAKAWAASEEQKAAGMGNDQPSALTKLYDEMLQDPERFPEMAQMRTIESALQEVLDVHEDVSADVDTALITENQFGLRGIEIEDALQTRESIFGVCAALREGREDLTGVKCDAAVQGFVDELVSKETKAPVAALTVRPPEVALASPV